MCVTESEDVVVRGVVLSYTEMLMLVTSRDVLCTGWQHTQRQQSCCRYYSWTVQGACWGMGKKAPAAGVHQDVCV